MKTNLLVTYVTDLEEMLEALADELTQAKYELGELPSSSHALCEARSYLAATRQTTGTEYGHIGIPNLLRKQAM